MVAETGKQKYFFTLSMILMAKSFLPIVFNNLPLFIGSTHLWSVIWGVSLLFFQPNVLSNKAIIYLAKYGFFIFVATLTFYTNMDDVNYKNLFSELYNISVSVSIITYYYETKDFINLAKLIKWSLVFLFITTIMTIISSSIDPYYARNLTGLSLDTVGTERDNIIGMRRYGGGDYSAATVFMSIIPFFVYFFKNQHLSIMSKTQITLFAVLIFLALIGMQIFANLIFGIFLIIISFFGLEKLKNSILFFAIFFAFLFVIPKDIYVSALIGTASYFTTSKDINHKFADLAVFIETGAEVGDNSNEASMRAERYPMLFDAFVQNPLLGCYFNSDKFGNGYRDEGAHLYLMNKLTIMGIIAFIAFLIIPYRFIKSNLKRFNSKYNFFYIMASISIIGIGLFKVVGGRSTWYAFFVILPGIYYLPLLKKTKGK